MNHSDIQILALTHQEQKALDALLAQWKARLPRNNLRAEYYDAKNAVQNLGIAVPPYLQKLDTVLGWPAKAVDHLSSRVVLEKFVVPGSDVDALGLTEHLDANYFDLLAPQTQSSALLHGTAFITTTLGDTSAGEPEVLILGRDALTGTGIFDPRRRELSAALSIIRMKEGSESDPAEMVVYFPDYTMTLTHTGSVWQVDRRPHRLGRVPVVPMPYRPRLGRPFGTSRLTRPVMTITDSAMRTVIRSEVGAEFFSAPQRVLLGADETAFMDDNGNLLSQWEAIIGRVWAVPMGEDADGNPVKPEVQQMPQVSMQPHTDQLRSFAALFSAASNLPLDALGIVQDNPSSAEAIYAGKEDLLLDAESAQDSFGFAYRQMSRNIIELVEGRPVPEADNVRTVWRDASTPSRAQRTDAVSKLIASGVLPPDSEVTWEMLGFDEATIERLKHDQRRRRGAEISAGIAAAAQQALADPAVADLATRPGNAEGAIR